MGSLLLSVLVAYGACGPPYGPFALFTSQSVESGWGPSWNGVSLLFATDADTVDMGARMNVEMFFRFLPLESDGRVTAFVGHPEYPPRLVFSEPATETTYVRETSHDMGIGIIDVPALHGHLRAGGFRSQCETFHLLADDGEQIPPGDYQVHLEYSNPGAVERVHWGDDGCPESEPYPAGVVWSGSLSTRAVPLHIRDKGPERLPCELPTRINIIASKSGRLLWGWDFTSFEPDTLTVRPGFVVGCRTDVRKHVGEKPAPVGVPAGDGPETLWFREIPRRAVVARLGGLPRKGIAPWGDLGGLRAADIIMVHRKLTAEFDVTVFETSRLRSGVSWRPEAGDYRILRKYKIRAIWPPEP